MKKIFFLQLLLLCISFTGFSQSWDRWIPVGKGIEVSFKFSQRGCQGYTFARIRNNGYVTFSRIRVSFTVSCDNEAHEASVSAYKLGPGSIDEQQGNWYNTNYRVTDIRLTNAETFTNYNDHNIQKRR
ncbi:MAG TPA: hypothetical protein VL307_08895 [Chitinophagaceae bacterium]|jgi:hypothetical protein|nr:hypothetical protein [Chitinophagaceae bacterium]